MKVVIVISEDNELASSLSRSLAASTALLIYTDNNLIIYTEPTTDGHWS